MYHEYYADNSFFLINQRLWFIPIPISGAILKKSNNYSYVTFYSL